MNTLAFEDACLGSTLRTLNLKPNDILESETRLPPNTGDELLCIARPTWIGKDYCAGGVLLIGKNPAGGTPRHREKSHASDPTLAKALRRLISERSVDAYRAWRDDAQPQAMATWRIWNVSVRAILEQLHPAVGGPNQIAFGNLVPFRSNDNKVSTNEYVAGWSCDLAHVVRLLQPRLVIKMTAEFPRFNLVAAPVEVLTFSRANGDTYVTDAGKRDLELIRKWADRLRAT